MPDTSLSVDDVAQELGVNPETVRTWIRSGELSALDLGGGYRISREDLNEFLQQRRKPRPRRKKSKEEPQ